jgi:CBS domain-containing protein
MRPKAQTVEEIMTRDPVTVTPSASLRDAAALLVEHRISGAPVVDDAGTVVGVLSEADLLVKEGGPEHVVGGLFLHPVEVAAAPSVAKWHAHTVAEAMTFPARTIEPRETVAKAARTMVEQRINRLLVVEGGALVGIVTRADVVRALTRSDDAIERDVHELVIDPMQWIRSDRVGVVVRDGVVELAGSVESEFDAELVVRNVSALPGVIGVRSALEWHLDRKGRELRKPTRGLDRR